GPLPAEVVRAIEQGDLVAAAVLSGNRNFEGRINPHVRANYLASPPLVVAYALAGTVDIDLLNQPLGYDQDGEAVFLRDLWPSQEETRRVVERTLDPQSFRQRYADVFTGNPTWNDIAVSEAELYRWDQSSTYIQEPPFFFELGAEGPPPADILGARTLALLGDSVTTDHISPAGAIPANSPAGSYLIERGVQPRDFNSFGSRRGNHHVMTRGTFGNIRLKNLLVPGIEGGVTIHLPSLEQMSVYQAATRYREEGVPLILVAGKEYGSGSSRDWAAKGTSLLGVRAVLAESYERIHRSNLIGMGVLPLEFVPGQNFETLGLSGYEAFDIKGIGEAMQTGAMLTVLATQQDGSTVEFEVRSRIDTSIEKDYYRNGGILHTVLQSMLPKP
ncbi:MAG: aconitase family protein, partial [Anaerolineales bacterium]